jgi:hypothetical protein
MTLIVARTRHGDTIFVSHPSHAAEALVLWASTEYGHSQHSIETLENGFIKVDIPGLTSIAFGPENDEAAPQTERPATPSPYPESVPIQSGSGHLRT